jgi:hypothetical protein
MEHNRMSRPDDNTLETIRASLEYHDTAVGALIWKIGRKKGELAGSFVGPHKELRVRVNGQSLSAAKIVWFLVLGWWPENRLRRVNLDYDDIRIDNLEETHRREGPGR